MSLKVDPDWWKNLFDEIYLVTDARSVCNDEVTRQEVDVFSKIVPFQPQNSILDLCGGQGRHAIELCRRGFLNCTVLDYSHRLLNIGSENARDEKFEVRFIHGDARSTGLLSEEYDLVLILGNSMGYICEEDADLAILKETLRVLKKGGWLLLDIADGKAVREKFTPVSWHEIGNDVIVCRQRILDDDAVCAREIVLSKEDGLIRDETYRIRLYEKKQITELVKNAGFDNIKVHSFENDELANKDDLGCMNHRLFLTARK